MSTTDAGTQAVLAAYERLSPAERLVVDQLAATLSERINQECDKVRMGTRSALELIGKMGMLLARHGPETELAPQVALVAQTNSGRG
jgi:hypothetical protein